MNILFHRKYKDNIIVFNFKTHKWYKLNITFSKLFELYYIDKFTATQCVYKYKHLFKIKQCDSTMDYQYFRNFMKKEFGFLKIYPSS